MSMTNEDLARLIQEGNEELHPVLWQKVNKLLYVKAATFYNSHTEACARCGVELSDIRQECYAVYLAMLKAYDTERGLTFTAYLDYPFQNAVNALLGLRTERGRQEPLNHAASLDKPIETADGDSCTLMDMVQDDTSTDFLERMEDIDEAACVRQAVDDLPEPLRMVIRRYYLENRPLHEIGKEMDVSIERVRQYKAKGLRELRKNKRLQSMYKEQCLHETWLCAARWEHSPEHFDLVQRLRERGLSYGYKQAELYAARQKWEQENAEPDADPYRELRAYFAGEK